MLRSSGVFSSAPLRALNHTTNKSLRGLISVVTTKSHHNGGGCSSSWSSGWRGCVVRDFVGTSEGSGKVTTIVFSRGDNCHGALGNNSFLNHNRKQTPTKSTKEDTLDQNWGVVEGTVGSSPVSVACGWGSAVTLTGSGQLLQWGWVLDLRTTIFVSSLRANLPKLLYFMQNYLPGKNSWWNMKNADTQPYVHEELANKQIVHVACGGAHIAAVDADGQVYTWGENSQGQLGVGDYVRKEAPTLVNTGDLRHKKAIAVSCGYQNTTVLTEDGCVYEFGKVSTRPHRNSPDRSDTSSSPRLVPYLSNPHNDASSTTTSTSSTSTTASNSFSSGKHSGSQGVGEGVETIPSRVVAVASGFAHSVAVCEQGRVYSWGRSQFGQTGRDPQIIKDAELQESQRQQETQQQKQQQGRTQQQQQDQDNRLPSEENDGDGPRSLLSRWHAEMVLGGGLEKCFVVKVACGQQHSIALTDDGQVFVWGLNSRSQLGMSEFDVLSTHIPHPLPLHSLDGVVCDIFGGFDVSCLLTDKGTLYEVGSGNPNPTPVYKPSKSKHKKIAYGSHHSLMLVEVHKEGKKPGEQNVEEN